MKIFDPRDRPLEPRVFGDIWSEASFSIPVDKSDQAPGNESQIKRSEIGIDIQCNNGQHVHYIRARRLVKILEQNQNNKPENDSFVETFITDVLDRSSIKVLGNKFFEICKLSLRHGRLRLELNEDCENTAIELLKFHHWRHKPLSDQDEQKAESDIISQEKCYVLKNDQGIVIIDFSEHETVGHELQQWVNDLPNSDSDRISFSCPSRLLVALYKMVLRNQDNTASMLEKRIEELNFIPDFNQLNESEIIQLGKRFSAQSRELSAAVGKLIEHEPTVSQTFQAISTIVKSDLSNHATKINYNLTSLFRLFHSQVKEASSDLQTLTSTIAAFDRFVTERQKHEIQLAKMTQAEKADNNALALQNSNLAVAKSNLSLQKTILILSVPVATASALQVTMAITPNDIQSMSYWITESIIFFVLSSSLAYFTYKQASNDLKEQVQVVRDLEKSSADLSEKLD